MNILDLFEELPVGNGMNRGFNIMFVIVSIFIGLNFVFVIAVIISPKLRGKIMSRQVKAVKHMTDYSKGDMEDIGYNVADSVVNAKKRVLDKNYENLTDMATKEANIKKEAIRVKVNAVKEGLTSSIYCKYCGEKIDSDSRYCNYCGNKIKK